MIAPKKAPDAILKLSDIMEYVIYDCRQDKVPVVKELRFISSYIDLEKLRYDDSANIETRLDSRYGKYFENIGKVYLRDSVTVITVKGDTLRSPDLWWDQNTKLFYTDKYAVYTGIGKVIHGGKGLVATQDLNSIIFNEPTGTMQTSQNGFPK